MLDQDPVVRDLCSAHPLALPVVSRHSLSSCGPTRRLGAWCAEQGVAPSAVLAEIEHDETALAVRCAALSLPDLLEHIVRTYHRPFEAELSELLDAIHVRCHRVDQPGFARWQVLLDLFEDLRSDMLQHIAKEERILFPWLRGQAETAAAQIRAMQLGHADTIGTLIEIRGQLAACHANASPDEVESIAHRVDRIERWICEHLHLERNDLFPRALAR